MRLTQHQRSQSPAPARTPHFCLCDAGTDAPPLARHHRPVVRRRACLHPGRHHHRDRRRRARSAARSPACSSPSKANQVFTSQTIRGPAVTVCPIGAMGSVISPGRLRAPAIRARRGFALHAARNHIGRARRSVRAAVDSHGQRRTRSGVDPRRRHPHARELQALRGVTLDDPMRALHALPAATSTDSIPTSPSGLDFQRAAWRSTVCPHGP